MMLACPDRLDAKAIGFSRELEPFAIGLVVRFAPRPMRLEAEGDAEFWNSSHRTPVILSAAKDLALATESLIGRLGPSLKRADYRARLRTTECHSSAFRIRAQSASASSCPGTIWIVNWVKPALRKASIRCLISPSVAVNDVERIRSAVMNFFSSGFTNIRWPRWFSR